MNLELGLLSEGMSLVCMVMVLIMVDMVFIGLVE